jgi:hypothetical protein
VDHLLRASSETTEDMGRKIGTHAVNTVMQSVTTTGTR